jgi:hypothetical protein
VTEERKRKVKGRRRQRVRRVWGADEWLSKVDWGRFGPANPKRQAWEIIRRLANATGGLPDGATPPAVSWADRVRR